MVEVIQLTMVCDRCTGRGQVRGWAEMANDYVANVCPRCWGSPYRVARTAFVIVDGLVD